MKFSKLILLLFLLFNCILLVNSQDKPVEDPATETSQPVETTSEEIITRAPTTNEATSAPTFESSSTSDYPTTIASSTSDSTNPPSSTSSTYESTSTSTSTSSSTSTFSTTSESSTTSSTTLNSSTETVPSGVSIVTETNPGQTSVVYAVEGTLRFNADFNSIKNRTQFSEFMSNSLSNYFGFPTRVLSLKSGSIIIVYMVLAPGDNVGNIVSLVNSLSNSDSFAGYDIIAPTSAAAVPSSARGSNSSSSTNVGLIAGIVGGVAAAVIIVAIIIAVVVVKKKRSHNSTESPKKNSDLEKGKHETDSLRKQFEMKEVSPNLYGGGAVVIPKSNTDSGSERRRNSGPRSWEADSSSTMMTSSSNPSHVFLKNIEVGQKLGSGTFGDVYMAKWGKSTTLALKAMKELGDSDSERSFINEVALLMKLNHPNVVRAMGVYRDPQGKLYLAMEYLSKGSLLSFLRRPEVKEKMNIMDLVSMSIHVAAGMMYLEDKKIIHRDLAARNLLVTEVDGKFLVKIADLGLSRESDSSIYQSKEPTSLPIRWSPPEVIQSNSYSHHSDVWSFAVSLWEIFEYGKEPYSGMSNVRTVQAVLFEGFRLARPLYCPESIYNLMLRCWRENPAERPSFEEIWKELTEISARLEEENCFGGYNSNHFSNGEESSYGSFMNMEDLENFLSPSYRAPTPPNDRIERESQNEYIRTFDDV
eukprot:TRINITY_DN133_c0_g1_i3.p1 TRINITY_DN133_c0_g1~~TRINITY_DN133_c0_g1_i3.p1  ORF type:complete len:700 (+),score=220.02 TRINITY_DN133_c0_g1_i3:265-2364(+)